VVFNSDCVGSADSLAVDSPDADFSDVRFSGLRRASIFSRSGHSKPDNDALAGQSGAMESAERKAA
jgi:hypothetical protein